MPKDKDILYMQRALDLAEKGRGSVSPNPMVGCVLVHNDQIVGEGWHEKYGEAHAEVNAISSIVDEALLSECKCYVTLEPCSHHGKTPPCSDLLIKKGIRQVIIGCQDTNPQVGGNGIRKLKEAGIDVQVGVLEKKCRDLNRRFFSAIEKNRPYVILKWAQTADGFIARKDFDSKWISNEESRALVHQWRAHEDAILVGTNTAKYDNPRLNVRGYAGNDPMRIVIDRHLKLDEKLNLFDRSQPTLVFNESRTSGEGDLEFAGVDFSELELNILKELSKRKIQSLIVEGGAHTLNSWIQKGLWDEARVFMSNTKFERGIAAPILESQPQNTESVNTDTLKIYYNE